MRIIEAAAHLALDDYAATAELRASVELLRTAATPFVRRLRGRTVWMVNSTAVGGGVAELLPPQIAILRELGVDVRWAVIETAQPGFFELTKRLHNLVHGVDAPAPTAAERALYEEVSVENAAALEAQVAPRDVLVVHDPQPLGTGALLAERLGTAAIWRCHIGIEGETPASCAAWEFLRPYAERHARCVFSAREYVPPFLRARTSVVHPTIDPLSHKNRPLSLHKLVGVLADAGLVVVRWPLVAPPFAAVAHRLQPDGQFAPATEPEDIGLLARPIVAQVSRWDRLKGFAPLLEGFAALKRAIADGTLQPRDDRHARRLAAARLVLAGPEEASIQDDPEASEVLRDLVAQYRALDAALQADVAVLSLPMHSRKENALMVNALQRCADVVAQNSLREGFGLTVAEAMWKGKAVLGSAAACGVRLQVRDGEHGRLVAPDDAAAIAGALHDMLADEDRLERWGRDGRRRVHEEFLVFSEVAQWLELLADAADGGAA